MKLIRPSTLAIVSTTVAIVLLPIGRLWFENEMVRWNLAAAATAVELGEGNDKEYLAAARRWADSGLEEYRDYWIYRFQKTVEMDRDPKLLLRLKATEDKGAVLGLHDPNEFIADSVTEVIEAAREASPDNVSIVYPFIQQWTNDEVFSFSALVEMLEACETAAMRRNVGFLNLLAYMRALEKQDLDLALADIDKALEKQPSNWGFLDTRAWVLHQMGRSKEALLVINKSIKLEQRSRINMVNALNALLFEEEGDASTQDSPSVYEPRKRREVSPQLWGRGVTRYHRAEILKELGEDENAEKDYDWLRRQQLPIDGTLY